MNKVILMGRLVRDPELRETSNNKKVCRFTLAVPKMFSKDNTADFFPMVAWGKTAEFINKHFNKGMQMAVVGRMATRSWQDKDGKTRYTTEVVVVETYFASSKNNGKIGDSSNAEVKAGNTGNANSQIVNSAGFYPINEDDEMPF